MSIFSQLKQQLKTKFSQVDFSQGLIEIQASLALSVENLRLLAWLKAQKGLFPHFFWQSRDTDQTIATAGQVQAFSCLEDAQSFINSFPFSLFGGVQFEGKCQFVLPRFVLVKEAEKLTAYAYFTAEELASQAVEMTDFFANFDQTAPLAENALANNPQLACSMACDFEQWSQNIGKAINEIERHTFSKVVLANATTLTFRNPLSAYDLLAKSQQINFGCYHFLWAENAETMFFGSSPERLYQRQQQSLFTEALAGTVAVSENEEETENNAKWLLNDHKNIFENQLVVDDIYSNLRECVDEFEVKGAEIKRLHNVQHLRRQIRTQLKAEIRDIDCLTKIHPTAAVAGLPRQIAKQFIAKHEPFTRNWYAGTLGFFNRSQAEFCVTLRSAQVENQKITLYAGAGIVAESEPLSEWHEIERKSQGIAKLLK